MSIIFELYGNRTHGEPLEGVNVATTPTVRKYKD